MQVKCKSIWETIRLTFGISDMYISACALKAREFAKGNLEGLRKLLILVTTSHQKESPRIELITAGLHLLVTWLWFSSFSMLGGTTKMVIWSAEKQTTFLIVFLIINFFVVPVCFSVPGFSTCQNIVREPSKYTCHTETRKMRGVPKHFRPLPFFFAKIGDN